MIGDYRKARWPFEESWCVGHFALICPLDEAGSNSHSGWLGVRLDKLQGWRISFCHLFDRHVSSLTYWQRKNGARHIETSTSRTEVTTISQLKKSSWRLALCRPKQDSNRVLSSRVGPFSSISHADLLRESSDPRYLHALEFIESYACVVCVR